MCGDKVILVALIFVVGQSFFTNAAPLEKTWSIVKINPPKVGDIRLKEDLTSAEAKHEDSEGEDHSHYFHDGNQKSGDNDVGYLKKHDKKGQDGFEHYETFHDKDADAYGYEKHEIYGEGEKSKTDSGSENKGKLESEEHGGESGGKGGDHEESSYEVTENYHDATHGSHSDGHDDDGSHGGHDDGSDGGHDGGDDDGHGGNDDDGHGGNDDDGHDGHDDSHSSEHYKSDGDSGESDEYKDSDESDEDDSEEDGSHEETQNHEVGPVAHAEHIAAVSKHDYETKNIHPLNYKVHEKTDDVAAGSSHSDAGAHHGGGGGYDGGHGGDDGHSNDGHGDDGHGAIHSDKVHAGGYETHVVHIVPKKAAGGGGGGGDEGKGGSGGKGGKSAAQQNDKALHDEDYGHQYTYTSDADGDSYY